MCARTCRQHLAAHFAARERARIRVRTHSRWPLYAVRSRPGGVAGGVAPFWSHDGVLCAAASSPWWCVVDWVVSCPYAPAGAFRYSCFLGMLLRRPHSELDSSCLEFSLEHMALGNSCFTIDYQFSHGSMVSYPSSCHSFPKILVSLSGYTNGQVPS